MKQTTSAANGRYQAQYLYRAEKCERCGKVEPRLHRHHRNHIATDNRPENIEILCALCHVRHHLRPPVQSVCVVCGNSFVAKHHRKKAKCCSAPCVSEWGRTCAEKRWRGVVSDACAPPATRSSRR